MEAGISKHVWTLEEIVALIEECSIENRPSPTVDNCPDKQEKLDQGDNAPVPEQHTQDGQADLIPVALWIHEFGRRHAICRLH